jgi:hypothetical protein
MNYKDYIPLPNCSADYTAHGYVTEFEHDKPMKYYFGSKDGLFDGTYEGSPKAHEKEYFQDLRKYDHKCYQIDAGDLDACVWNEIDLLSKIKRNSKKGKKTFIPFLKKEIGWDEVYNEAINGGRHLKNYNSAVQDIKDGVEEETFPITYEDKKTVFDYEPFQPRFQYIIPAHKKELGRVLKDSNGRWPDEINVVTGKRHHRGVITFKNYHEKGKHRRIGSNHLVASSQNVKQVDTLRVIWIPEKLWKKLSEEDILELAQWDNPQDTSAPRLVTPEEESAAYIARVCLKENITPDHPSFWVKFQDQDGSIYKFRPIQKKARKIIKDKKKFILSGEKQINWKEGAPTEAQIKKGIKPKEGTRAAELQQKIDNFKGVAWSGSVGNPDAVKLKLVELLKKNPEQTNYRFFEEVPVKIGAVDIKQEWDLKGKPLVMEMFLMFEKEFRTEYSTTSKKNEPTLNIDMRPLDFTEPDSSQLN